MEWLRSWRAWHSIPRAYAPQPFWDCWAGLCALVLAVTMYAITRDQDRDLAMLGLTCRVAEGVIGAALTPASLGLLSIAMASGATAPDPTAAQAIAAFVLEQPGPIGGWFFAVGSTLFSWLLLPVALAWIGVVASAMS